MGIGDKLIEAAGEKSRDISQKLTQKYRDHLGDDLLKKQEQLQNVEAQLDERGKALDARENVVSLREEGLNKYYLIPRNYIKVPLGLAIIAILFISYQEFSPDAQIVISGTSSTSKTITTDQSGSSVSGHKNTSYSGCVRRGIAYYKEIDSYPYLSTGEDAEKKVKGMCRRSNGMAFGR